MTISDGRLSGDLVPQSGSSSKMREVNMVQYVHGGDEDEGEEGVAFPGAPSLPHSLEDGGAKERSKSNSPPRRRKKKGLFDLGEPFSHPRRSARLNKRFSQASTSSNRRDVISLASISDRDIKNWNSRLYASRNMEESSEVI